MEQEDQFSLEIEHLLFKERTCIICKETKDLLTDFYLTRKSKRYLPSSYAYECKDCTVKRILSNRHKKISKECEYPDW
jgi:hypothetical protein